MRHTVQRCFGLIVIIGRSKAAFLRSQCPALPHFRSVREPTSVESEFEFAHKPIWGFILAFTT